MALLLQVIVVALVVLALVVGGRKGRRGGEGGGGGDRKAHRYSLNELYTSLHRREEKDEQSVFPFGCSISTSLSLVASVPSCMS